MKPQVIFFDMGETLVTGLPRPVRRILASRLHLGDKEMKHAGRLIMTHPSTDPFALAAALAEALPGIERCRLRDAVEHLWMEQIDCVRALPGAGSLLGALKSDGFNLGIISNTWHPFYLGFSRYCPEIRELIDYTVLSYRAGCKKPSQDIYREALRQAGVPAASCWMIGDTYELDVQPAQQAGMRTVWVLRSPHREKPLLARVLRGERPLPDWTTDGIDEIYSLFKNPESDQRCRSF